MEKLVDKIVISLLMLSVLTSCEKYAPCERYFIPKNFIGDVTVYYNEVNRNKVVDDDGCIVHVVSKNGECYTGFPYKKSRAIVRPGETYKYFLTNGKDSIEEIFEFSSATYLENERMGKITKYISYYFGGIQNGKPVSGFTVDYGIRFMNNKSPQ